MSAESTPTRIIFPQSTLYGWNPLSFEPTNEVIKTSFYSGDIHRHLMNAIAFSFKEQSKEYIEKKQNLISLTTRVDRYAAFFIPGGDFDSVLGLAISMLPGFICDDVRDRSSEDKTTNHLMTDALLRIPKLVNEHWQRNGKTVVDREQTALEVVEEYGMTGSAEIDGFSRLLALGAIFARTKAGNDATYGWYVEEWIRWASQPYSIRDRHLAGVSEQELLDHRLENSGTQTAISQSVVFSGISVSRESIHHPLHQILLDTQALHIVLLNDIFSYDREKGMVGAVENLVEYWRLFHTPGQNLDQTIDHTIQRVNEYMEEFLKAWKVAQTMDEEMKLLAMTSARHMFGNIAWSMEAPRYSRQKFVAEAILLK